MHVDFSGVSCRRMVQVFFVSCPMLLTVFSIVTLRKHALTFALTITFSPLFHSECTLAVFIRLCFGLRKGVVAERLAPQTSDL